MRTQIGGRAPVRLTPSWPNDRDLEPVVLLVQTPPPQAFVGMLCMPLSAEKGKSALGRICHLPAAPGLGAATCKKVQPRSLAPVHL